MSKPKNVALTKQITQIYDLFAKYEDKAAVPLFGKPSFNHPQSRHILKRYVIAPFVAACLFSIFLFASNWPLEYVKLPLLLLLLVWYVALPSIQIMELYAERGDLIQFFKNPNQLIIKGLTKTITPDSLLANELKNHSKEALQLAKIRTDVQLLTIKKRFGTLLGALDKIGIIPGLITLFLAASSTQNELFTFSTAIVIFILYAFAFSINFSASRFDFYLALIENVLKTKD